MVINGRPQKVPNLAQCAYTLALFPVLSTACVFEDKFFKRLDDAYPEHSWSNQRRIDVGEPEGEVAKTLIDARV